MRYCNNCHRITAGEPLFCNFCGRSYDSKLCPHRHPNPRSAEICSQCGSRDLSTPHPRMSVWLVPLLALLTALPGLLLLAITVSFALAFVQALVSSPSCCFNSCFSDYCLPCSGTCTCTFLPFSGDSSPDYFDAPTETTMDTKLPNPNSQRLALSPKANIGKRASPRDYAAFWPFP